MNKFLSVLLCLGAAVAQTPAPKPKAAVAARPKPAVAAKPKPAPQPGVLQVGGESYSRADFELLLEVLPPQLRAQSSTPEGRRQIAGQLVEILALAQEARRRGLHEEARTKQQIRLQSDQVLASALIGKLMEAAPLPEEKLRAYYEEQKANQYQQVKARHILIRFQGSQVPLKTGQKDLTEAEALAKIQQVRERIEGGGDFAEIAKAESDDVGSGASGGALGTFGRGQMVPEFEKTAFSLAKGALSEPVRTQFGYHIIQVEDQVNRQFEQVRGEIEQRLRPEYVRELAQGVSKKAGVVMDEGYFGKDPAAQ